MRISDCSVGRQILKQIRDRITLALQCGSRKRNAGSRLRINAGRVIDEVCFKAALLDLFRRQIAGQLIDNCCNHLLMSKFFCADVCQDRLALLVRHGVALVEIAHRCTNFTIRPA